MNIFVIPIPGPAGALAHSSPGSLIEYLFRTLSSAGGAEYLDGEEGGKDLYVASKAIITPLSNGNNEIESL